MNLPPRLLHIGQRKTATTWVQQAAENAAAAGHLTFCHWELAKWLRGLGPDKSAPSQEALDALAGLLPQDRTRPCFASLEGMVAFDPAALAASVRRVWPDVHVLVTTRGPQAYLTSSFNNSSFRSGVPAQKFAAVFSRGHMVKAFSLDAWAAVMGAGRISFLPYEMLVADQAGWLARVSGLLGTDLAPFAPPLPVNVSPPAEYLLLQRRVVARLAAEAPGVLESRDWADFMRMANFSAGSAAGLTEYFASYFRAHPLGRGDMPQLDDAALVRLAAGMTVLAGLPDYAPYLVRYGLTGKVEPTGNQGEPA
jgi:hypothetical protein